MGTRPKLLQPSYRLPSPRTHQKNQNCNSYYTKPSLAILPRPLWLSVGFKDQWHFQFIFTFHTNSSIHVNSPQASCCQKGWVTRAVQVKTQGNKRVNYPKISEKITTDSRWNMQNALSAGNVSGQIVVVFSFAFIYLRQSTEKYRSDWNFFFKHFI